MENIKLDILQELENRYYNLKMNYYRFVIREEDRAVIQKVIKIPESWEMYKSDKPLSDEVKYRLSDLKKKKSWEIKLESLYLFSITEIENVMISVFLQRKMDVKDLDAVVDYINTLILEKDDNLINLKYLLLTLAKRSISDFYYLLMSYSRFFKKKNFVFENDFKTIMLEFIALINLLKKRYDLIDKYIKYSNDISTLFEKSSNQLGWRINEFAVKEFLEKENPVLKIAHYRKFAKEAFIYKKELMNFYSFLKYYYNENDGKLFRLNFISESLKTKFDEGKITEEVYNSFEEIRESFRKYKIEFEKIGLKGFGNPDLQYIVLIDFIYKICKIVEFYYLRNMKYEDLQVFRNDILFYIEKEVLSLKG